MQILGKVGHTMKYKILTIVEIVFFAIFLLVLGSLFVQSASKSIDGLDGLAIGIVVLLFLPSFICWFFIFSFIRCVFSGRKNELVVPIVGIIISSIGFLCPIGELFFKSTGDPFWLISWMLILVAIICRIIVLACRKKANNN